MFVILDIETSEAVIIPGIRALSLSMMLYKPSQTDMLRLKQPFGRLIPGDPERTMPHLKSIVKKDHPVKITAVGDVVSRETLRAGVPVNLRIIDHISMRKPSAAFVVKAEKTFNVRNPAGTITQESWDAIKEAIRSKDALIIVDGEEDLLTLPCIIESPENALVLYGQPSQGLVVVDVSMDAKREVSKILERMIIERDD